MKGLTNREAYYLKIALDAANKFYGTRESMEYAAKYLLHQQNQSRMAKFVQAVFDSLKEND